MPKVAPDVAFRKGLEERVAKGQAKALFQELKMVDPAAADNIDPRNVRRVIRALEVNKLSKNTFSQLQQKQAPTFQTLIIGLTADRKELYRRADARIDNMISHGFMEEVGALLQLGFTPDLPALSSIGYREIIQYLQGGTTLEEAVYKIKTGTHRFIRHQYAWFRLKDERIKWFDVEKTSGMEIEQVVDIFIKS